MQGGHDRTLRDVIMIVASKDIMREIIAKDIMISSSCRDGFHSTCSTSCAFSTSWTDTSLWTSICGFSEDMMRRPGGYSTLK
jgi:hypothetical protein